MLNLFLQICDAISYAHQRGVIHRDLKPSNVLIDASGNAHIVDFGLAKPIDPSIDPARSALTQIGDFAGTWYYASPEQVKKDPSLVDVRSEVYTLGLILFEMLTDCYPYPQEPYSVETLIRHILNTEPVRPRAIRRDLDDDIETIVLRCLSKASERRYQSVSALADDVRRYLGGAAIEAKRDNTWYVLTKTLRRHRWRATAAGAVLCAVVAFGVVVFILYRQAEYARATTEARMAVVRQSQKYQDEKIEELGITYNRLHEIAVAHPDLPELHNARDKTWEPPWPELSRLVGSMPKDIAKTVRGLAGPEYEVALEWLSTHQDELSELASLAHAYRMVSPLERKPVSDLALADCPANTRQCVLLGQALIACAERDYTDHKHEAAVFNLEASRLLAQDMGDERHWVAKADSVAVRRLTYEAVLWILSRSHVDPEVCRPYIEWVARDPPLVRYGPAMSHERRRLAQLIEGATVKYPRAPSAHLDLNALDALTAGYFRTTGQYTEALEALAKSVTPTEALRLIDAHITELESWDSLDLGELEHQASKLAESLRGQRAQPLLEGLLPRLYDLFVHRASTGALRTGALLTAGLVEHHSTTGSWPNTLDGLTLCGRAIPTNDPSTGRPFAYKFTATGPVLYTPNASAGAADHNWRETATVFFEPIHPGE